MKEPVDHVLRPRLPWREDSPITECGLNAASVKTLTRDEVNQRWKEMGQQRAAMLTCMTCLDTARRWQSWEIDPRQALEREIAWEGSGRWSRGDRGQRLKDELTVIAEMIAERREEFLDRVRAVEQRRAWVAQKEAAAKAKKEARKINPYD